MSTWSDLVIPDIMDEEWLVKANATVDVALASDGFNEFNSGGIGVTHPLQMLLERSTYFVTCCYVWESVSLVVSNGAGRLPTWICEGALCTTGRAQDAWLL